ncbi:MAG TPA: FAD-binding protein, partial [Terriglobales bacterium]|nr:FAD-binding protein [Terriglobales bacterium]
MEGPSTSRAPASVLDRGLSEISAIVGAGHVRDATAADAVCGAAVSKIVEPGTPEEVAAVLKAATAGGLAVTPRGGGSKLEWGNPPKRADFVLSTARLNQVEEHAWEDMTATVA